MKTLLACLACLYAGTVQAADCRQAEDVARTIMHARQAGMSLDTMLQISDDNPESRKLTRTLILIAFRIPIFTDGSAPTAVDSFAQEVRLICERASDGMSQF